MPEPVNPYPAFVAQTDRLQRTATVLVALGVVAVIGYLYFIDISRPRAGTNALAGWLDWHDQGKYYQSEAALTNGDFLATQHTYPPGYSLLGAPFIKLWPLPPFLPVILLSTFVIAWIFLTLARREVGLLPAIVLLAFGVFALPDVERAYVIPWTNTLSAALLCVLY